jgi:hypothetical protein
MAMRRLIAIAALTLFVSPAIADNVDINRLKRLLQPKYQVAEVIEAAGVAADKCPGLYVIGTMPIRRRYLYPRIPTDVCTQQGQRPGGVHEEPSPLVRADVVFPRSRAPSGDQTHTSQT